MSGFFLFGEGWKGGIEADDDEPFGQRVIPNGVALAGPTMLVRRPADRVDPEGRVHVSERLLVLHD